MKKKAGMMDRRESGQGNGILIRSDLVVIVAVVVVMLVRIGTVMLTKVESLLPGAAIENIIYVYSICVNRCKKDRNLKNKPEFQLIFTNDIDQQTIQAHPHITLHIHSIHQPLPQHSLYAYVLYT